MTDLLLGGAKLEATLISFLFTEYVPFTYCILFCLAHTLHTVAFTCGGSSFTKRLVIYTGAHVYPLPLLIGKAGDISLASIHLSTYGPLYVKEICNNNNVFCYRYHTIPVDYGSAHHWRGTGPYKIWNPTFFKLHILCIQ